MKKLQFSFVILLLIILLSPVKKANALTSVSDTISTSRPSTSANLSTGIAANATTATIVDVGTNIYLASDTARIKQSVGSAMQNLTVASSSAASGGTKSVYFVTGPTVAFGAGDLLMVPVTAMHKVQFKTEEAIPASGKIVITFPGSTNTTASPSATTFAFNGITSTQLQANGLTCDSWTISSTGAPTITCTSNAGAAANTTVTILIGCTSQSGGSCTAQAPRLINPTKSNTTLGAADTWRLNIETQDSGGTSVESAVVKIATVEAVQVQATVDPTLTVTIAGLNNNTNFNTVTGCASEVTNSGINASATSVNLGVLSSGIINKAGQTITVTTNAVNGYAITATSSGRLINPATGHWITDVNGGNGLTANDTPAPAVMPASGNPAFGIFPCGARVTTSSPDYDDESAIDFSSGGKGTNPWNTIGNGYYATIASYTGGSVASDATAIRYAATISTTTPAGTYTTVFTYVVTPTF